MIAAERPVSGVDCHVIDEFVSSLVVSPNIFPSSYSQVGLYYNLVKTVDR